MRADRQPGRGERKPGGDAFGRHALSIGLLVSLLLHLLLVVLNPSFRLVLRPMRAEPAPGEQEMGRLIQLSAREPAVGAATAEPRTEAAAAPATTPRDRSAPARPRDAQPAEGATTGVAPGERLRYRPGSIWAPMERRPLSLEECRRMLLAQRLERGIADETYGVAPPPTRVVPPPQTEGIGIRIPFGTRRPPPAQVVPAPLPDSLRGASHRPEARRPPPDTTPHAFFTRDCLSDTTLRMLPRLRQDTTRQ